MRNNSATKYLKDFFVDLYERIIDRFNFVNKQRGDEIAEYEEMRGIRRCIRAMLDAKVKDEKIISALQEHWDLRKSEAEDFLYDEKSRQVARLGSIKRTNKKDV